MRRKAAGNLVQRLLHLLDDDAKWHVVEPILRDLEGRGFRSRGG